MPTARRPVLATGSATAALLTTLLVAPTAGADTPAGPKLPTGVPEAGLSRLEPGQSISSASAHTSFVGLGLPLPGRTLGQPFTGTYLLLQEDGNLVEAELRSGRVLWSSGTAGAATPDAPATLTFQRDGNVVLYDAASHPRWSTGTAGTSARWFSVYGNGEIVTQDATGRVLSAAGPVLTPRPGVLVDSGDSTSHGYRWLVQRDGNVVLYATTPNGASRAVWSTGTAGAGEVRLAAQADGNLVVYQVASGRPVWASGSRGPVGYYQLDAQDDGNLVLYRTDGATRTRAIWASGTVGR